MISALVEPVSGPTIFADSLDRHGKEVHHVAYDCNGIPFDRRIAEFARRGFPLAQSGEWMDTNHFTVFETEHATTTCSETYAFPPDLQYREHEARFSRSSHGRLARCACCGDRTGTVRADPCRATSRRLTPTLGANGRRATGVRSGR